MEDTEAFLKHVESERKARLKLKARRIALVASAVMWLLIIVLIWLSAYDLTHPVASVWTGAVLCLSLACSIAFATNGGNDLPW
jgi:uncharacterized membrane protein (UPF0182 family)